jgi:hypothetical protein
MTTKGQIRRRYLTAHGAIMLCMGTTACILASLMAFPSFSQFCYTIAVVLLASCFLSTGFHLGVQVYRERSDRPLAIYFAVLLLATICWVTLWLMRHAFTNFCWLSVLTGMQGVVWGMWYVRLAFSLKGSSRDAAFLCVLAATSTLLGIVVATQSELTQLESVAMLAYYTLFIGTQILLSTLCLYRKFQTGQDLHNIPTLKNGEVFISQHSGRAVIQFVSPEPHLEENPLDLTAS